MAEQYRNPLEREAIERLEREIRQFRQMNRGEYIHYMTLGISDIERLLYYARKLEYELDYRDTMASVPTWLKE